MLSLCGRGLPMVPWALQVRSHQPLPFSPITGGGDAPHPALPQGSPQSQRQPFRTASHSLEAPSPSSGQLPRPPPPSAGAHHHTVGQEVPALGSTGISCPQTKAPAQETSQSTTQGAGRGVCPQDSPAGQGLTSLGDLGGGGGLGRLWGGGLCAIVKHLDLDKREGRHMLISSLSR